MIHVGISGAIASGKTTLAESLAKLATDQDYKTQIVGFATGVKELAAIMDIQALRDKIQSWGHSAYKSREAAYMIANAQQLLPTTPGIKNRKLLQFIGSQVGRGYLGLDTWIRHTNDLIMPDVDFVFTDDVRFDNEAQSVDAHVGITVQGDTSFILYEKRVKEAGYEYTYADHDSERSLTLSPRFIIPIGFNQAHVRTLFELIKVSYGTK